jgi:MYXO-CTERM domain-containing protein
MRDLTFRLVAALIAAGSMIFVARAAEAGVSCINACQSHAGQPSCASTGLGCSMITGMCVSCRSNQDCQPGGTCLANGHCMVDCTGDGGANDGAAADGMTVDGMTVDGTTPDAMGGADANTEDGAADATSTDGASADASDAASRDATTAPGSDAGNTPRTPIQTMPPSSGCSCRTGPRGTSPLFGLVALAAIIVLRLRDRGRR